MYSGQIVAWTGLVRVDGSTYTWLGAPNVDSQLANQTAFEYTASKSIFTIDVENKVEIKASFVSPLAPKDYSVQSVVASYLDVQVTSLDGSDHDVQLYTDISAGELFPCIRVPGSVLWVGVVCASRHRRYGIWDGVIPCLKQC